MINIYAFCDNNCKHLVYTREEVLSLLQQAINDGTLKNIDADYAAVKSVVDSNAGSDITFWTGTEAEFNALNPVPKVNHFIPRRGEDGKIYICIDDTSISNLPTTPYSADEIKAMCDGTYKAGKGNFVNNVGVAALWDKANDSFSVDRVGDIKTTLRPTLGDKWRLANGAYFKQSDAPALYDMLPLTKFSKMNSTTNSDLGTDIIYDDENRVFVVLGCSSAGYVKIGILDDINAGITYTDEKIYASAFLYNRYGYRPMLRRYNGTWYIFGISGSKLVCLYNQGDPFNDAWTAKTWDKATACGMTDGSLSVSDVCVSDDGVFVLAGAIDASAGNRYDYPVVLVSSDPINGDWVGTQVSASNTQNYAHIHEHDGLWVMSYGTAKSYIAYTTDIAAGTWTEVMLWSTTSSSYYACDLTYHDGTWYVLVWASSSYRIYYATDPAGTWAYVSGTDVGLSGKFGMMDSISVVNGVFVVGGGNSEPLGMLFWSENPLVQWTKVESIGSGLALSTAYGDGVWVTVEAENESNTTHYDIFAAPKLPTITHDGAYTYIRVKE